jgi:membrane protein required for colicin V production
MNWADYTLIAVILVSVLIGLFRGLIREVMALVVWVAAFWVAFVFADKGEALLAPTVDLPSARLAIAFALLFLAVLLLGSIINYLLGQLIEKTGLSGTDRFLGMFFGAARAMVLVLSLVLLSGLTPVPNDPWWQESKLLPRFQVLAQWSTQYLPEKYQGYFDYRSDPELIEQSSTGDNTSPEPQE